MEGEWDLSLGGEELKLFNLDGELSHEEDLLLLSLVPEGEQTYEGDKGVSEEERDS